MKRYRVKAGVARFGIGRELVLEAAQIRPRRGNLGVPRTWDGLKPCRVTALAPVEFKAGEIVGLPELPKNLAIQFEEVLIKAA